MGIPRFEAVQGPPLEDTIQAIYTVAHDYIDPEIEWKDGRTGDFPETAMLTGFPYLVVTEGRFSLPVLPLDSGMTRPVWDYEVHGIVCEYDATDQNQYTYARKLAQHLYSAFVQYPTLGTRGLVANCQVVDPGVGELKVRSTGDRYYGASLILRVSMILDVGQFTTE